MDVYVDNRSSHGVDDLLITKIKGCVHQCIEVENFPHNCEVSISLVDNDEIHELNKHYRYKDSPTDVLSFPMYESFEQIPNDMVIMLGDIILSMQKCMEQAQEYGHTFEKEVCYLVAHGMFHLFGYDHMEPGEKKVMREKEREVMKKISY